MLHEFASFVCFFPSSTQTNSFFPVFMCSEWEKMSEQKNYNEKTPHWLDVLFSS